MLAITVINQKGGSGKTTLALNLARKLQLLGHDVVLVDMDPQESASDWGAVKDDQSLSIAAQTKPTLENDIKKFADKDFVIIDGAPRLEELAVSAIKSANLVLIPVQPSPLDVWAASNLVKLVKSRANLTKTFFRAAFVMTRVIGGTKIAREVSEALTEYQLPILKSHISQRVSFATSLADGETVLDKGLDKAAVAEITALTQEILNFLNQ